MKWLDHKKKMITAFTTGFLVITGTYNAVVINSESQISGAEIRFVKRLDEIYGVVESGREVAASVSWKKLTPTVTHTLQKMKQEQVTRVVQAAPARAEEVSNDIPVSAAVQSDLNLNLTEVINPNKWKQGLSNTQFSGSLSTSNGVIESLDVSLPNGEGVSVSFSEMTGNVFEYDFNGELYSGMMYQVDQTSYMVTLTNGPLEGTRLRFVGEPSVDQQNLADNQPYQDYNPESDMTGTQEAYAQEEQVSNVQPPMDQDQAYSYDQQLASQQMNEQMPQEQEAYNFDQQVNDQQNHQPPMDQVQAYNYDQQLAEQAQTIQ